MISKSYNCNYYKFFIFVFFCYETYLKFFISQKYLLFFYFFQLNKLHLRELTRNITHTIMDEKTVFNNQYKIIDLKPIGAGAQSIVYKIQDLKDNNKM